MTKTQKNEETHSNNSEVGQLRKLVGLMAASLEVLRAILEKLDSLDKSVDVIASDMARQCEQREQKQP